MALNTRQANIWTNDGLVYWRTYASHSLVGCVYFSTCEHRSCFQVLCSGSVPLDRIHTIMLFANISSCSHCLYLKCRRDESSVRLQKTYPQRQQWKQVVHLFRLTFMDDSHDRSDNDYIRARWSLSYTRVYYLTIKLHGKNNANMSCLAVLFLDLRPANFILHSC